MSYLVITRRPSAFGYLGVKRPIEHARRTVATLDEARKTAASITDRAWSNSLKLGRANRWNVHRDAAQSLPADGGTVGPLPDGTTIEVTPA